MRIEQRLYRIPQIQRSADSLRAWKIHRNPQSEEWSVNPALVQPWNVHMTHVLPFAQILTHHKYALDRVDVAVDSDSLSSQPPRLRGDLVYVWVVAASFKDGGVDADPPLWW